MAQYSALWTSSSDPEYIQMKKVKQLTERQLAMDISQMDKSYRRRLRKAQEQIRENQDSLEMLEREKETRARHILATYHKHQRMKSVAKRLIGNFRLRTENKDKPSVRERGRAARESVNRLEQKLMKTPGIRHRVLMVHTFPYVYHSYGDKPCPRYDMFLESQEFGPSEVTSDRQIPRSSVATSKRNSVDSRHGRLSTRSSVSAVPTLPPILEKESPKTSKSKVQNILRAFNVVNALSKH